MSSLSPKLVEAVARVMARAASLTSRPDFLEEYVDKNWPNFTDEAESALRAALPLLEAEVREKVLRELKELHEKACYSGAASTLLSIYATEHGLDLTQPQDGDGHG